MLLFVSSRNMFLDSFLRCIWIHKIELLTKFQLCYLNPIKSHKSSLNHLSKISYHIQIAWCFPFFQRMNHNFSSCQAPRCRNWVRMSPTAKRARRFGEFVVAAELAKGVDVHPETWRVRFFFKKNWEKVGISWFSSRKKRGLKWLKNQKNIGENLGFYELNPAIH